MQAAGIPDPKALPRCTGQPQNNGIGLHTGITVAPGYLARQPGAY